MAHVCDRCDDIIPWEDERELGRGNCSCSLRNVEYLDYIFQLYARSDEEAVERFIDFIRESLIRTNEHKLCSFSCGEVEEDFWESKVTLPDVIELKWRAVNYEHWNVLPNPKYKNT